MSSIDSIGRGFLGVVPDPNRYGHSFDPNGASGFICAMVPANSRVLDVGCGDGSLAEILRTRAKAEIFGIEPDPTRAGAAMRRGIPVHVGFLDEEFAAKPPAFDVVLFADVLEHVSDPFALLQHAIKCVAPGGSIIVSVPNVAHWSVRYRLLAGKFNYEHYGIMDATHLRWFTRASMLEFLRRAGLRPVDVRSTAGTFLDAYRRRPWTMLPSAIVWHLVVRLSRLWPAMFGCQIVIRAIKPVEGEANAARP